MAPTKTSSKGRSKSSSGSKGSKSKSGLRTSKPSTRDTARAREQQNSSSSSVKKSTKKQPKTIVPRKKKKRVYTEKELNIPALNMITPAGVQKPQGKKKGKVFVDDQESMMTILAIVNADKEGQIESKMMKARQMEEIRQARQQEMEARAQEKKSRLEDTKKSLRRKKKHSDLDVGTAVNEQAEQRRGKSGPKKRVSFG